IRFTSRRWMGKQGKHSRQSSKFPASPCDCSDREPAIDFCGAPISGHQFAFEVFVDPPGLIVPPLKDDYVWLKQFNLGEDILRHTYRQPISVNKSIRCFVVAHFTAFV